MDLFAYSQIEDLETIAKHNSIEVPRIRGYRLMSEERLFSKEEIQNDIDDMVNHVYERAMTSCPRFKPNASVSEFSPSTDRLKQKYLIRETVEDVRYDGTPFSYMIVKGLRWDKIHGKNRKAIKFAVKKAKQAVIKNLETFNKYVGRDDVLYIHARIGGDNWLYFGGANLEMQPWFLEKVDDYFDTTYCDIYAKIVEVPIDVLNKIRDKGVCDGFN